MIIEREKLMQGLGRYVREQILPSIPDKQTKMVMSMGLSVLECKPDMIDSILDNPLIPMENGELDIDMIERVVLDAVNEFGDITFTIPAIRFISPREVKLKFNADDIRKMINYIQ